MSGHEHYLKRCKNCQTVTGQCRCMGPKKTIWELCEKCKTSQNKCDINKSNFSDGLDAAALAKRFHETYEKLAPQFNYKTREESKVAWDDVPEANKKLMIATCAEILKQGN